MSEQPMVIPAAEGYLVADYQPGGAEGVVFLPGWSGTRYGPQRILWQAATACAARGLATLRFDFRGRGDAPGDSAAVTLDQMIEDAVVAVTWLRAQGVTRVYLVGLCSGGNVALGTAALCPEVTGVACWSLLPFMEHKSQAKQQGTPRWARLRQLVRKALRPETWKKLLRGEANVRGALGTVTKDKEGDDAEKRRKTSARDILRDLQGYQGRLLLLYGTRDPESLGSRIFFESWANRHRIPVDVHTIDGAPHNFYTAAWTTEVIARTAEWVKGES